MELEPIQDSTKQVEQVTAKHLGGRKDGSNLYEALIGYVTPADQLGVFPKPATPAAVPHPPSRDQAGGRASQFPHMTTFSDIVREHAAEATDEIEEHLTRLRQGSRQLESRLRRDESLAGLYRESNPLLSGLIRKYLRPVRPVAGNLAYRSAIGRPGDPPIYHDQQPGLVVASFFNLQPHLQLEFPDGSTALVDTDKWNDGGEIIWTEQGTAILKSLTTGKHSSEEVEIKGVTTKGCCLLRPPGRRAYVWMMPREPEEVGGQNRPTFFLDGNRPVGFALESLNVGAAVLTEYEDISGVVVKLQAPFRILRRHRDHLGLGH